MLARQVSASPDAELDKVRYVLIGASTGGPELLFRLLQSIPPPLPLPLLITQHTLDGFDESLAQWLATTGHKVAVARSGDIATPGRVLLAPADKHMRVQLGGIELTPINRNAEASNIDSMFETAAKFWGEHCLGFLLSGMGKDGALGMRALFDRGALTVVQAPHTCVVPSMAENARARGGVKRVLPPDEMAALLLKLAATRAREEKTTSWKGI